MADNVELNLGVGGKTIATDDIGGIQHELVKLEYGTDGNATMVSAGNPLPTTDAAADLSLASIDLKTPALGQAAMVASSPVVIASNQSAIPVTVNNAAGAAAVNIQDGGNIITVDGTVAIGAGSAVIGHVINDAGSAIIGKVGIDQTTPGTTNGVQVNAALPAGANVIGQVTANAGTNLNTSLLALEAGNLASILAKLTAAAASFVKLEDTAAVDGDAGVPAFAVRKSTPANSSGTDGDYEPLQMNAGKLWVQAGATQKPQIGATVVMTVAALQSLASSATVGWQSDRVSNLSTLANDYEIMVKLTTANTAPANDKCMYVFISAAYTSDGGTTWFQSSQGTTTLPSGSQGASTIASPNNLRLLGVLNYTTAQAVVQDTFLLSNCFGNRLPDGFSIIIINFSGAALSTGCIVDYSPLNDILV